MSASSTYLFTTATPANVAAPIDDELPIETSAAASHGSGVDADELCKLASEFAKTHKDRQCTTSDTTDYELMINEMEVTLNGTQREDARA